MLKELNDEKLIQIGVKEKVILFYQLWKELVNEKTLDIYQYRILTSLSALEELAEVLRKTIAGVFTNDAHVESCREETLYILNSDKLLENHYNDIGNLLNAEKRYFKVDICAFDIYSAAYKAIRQISNLLNMASFYNLVSAWNLSSVTFVSINNINKYHKAFNAEQLYRTYDYLDSSGKVFEHTRNIFVNEENFSLREKLTGAFGYANISRASLFQEEKYVNLWVALESLARTKMYPDIISNVKQTVPAAMSLRYIYRIVRNYVEDCIRCKVEFDFSNCNIDMKQDKKQKMVQETIELFKDSVLYNELLQKCEVNSLLKYRTQTVYELLTVMDKLKVKVKNHHDRVEWQIQRLYRIRNEIVHSALQNETSLIMYIEHLYDYLSTYITEIVRYMSDKKEITFEETLTIIKDNYDVFIAFMEQKDYQIIEEKVIKTGIISLI